MSFYDKSNLPRKKGASSNTEQSVRTPAEQHCSSIIQRLRMHPQSFSSTIGNQAVCQLMREIGALKDQPLKRRTLPNNTGLPDALKARVENLSGLSMDDVKVHYNSDKPMQVWALAYTQGTDIHLAPGQEKHLPHEAWHVVQQAQGRVSRTMQMKNVALNNDAMLEHEADEMGKKSSSDGLRPQYDEANQLHKCPNDIIQRTVIVQFSDERTSDIEKILKWLISSGYSDDMDKLTEFIASSNKEYDSQQVDGFISDYYKYLYQIGASTIVSIKSSDFEVLDTFTSGSTKPKLVKMKDGSKKVLKMGNLKDSGHIQTEILTQKLYQYAGIPTLDAEYILVDGKPAQLTDYVEGGFIKPEIDELRSSPDFYHHAAADMIFANCDMFKTDNWAKINGRMVRADVGGSLDRRAQGGIKEYSSEVAEFETMRKSKKDPTLNPYLYLTDHEIADSARTLAFNLTPEKIDQAFEASHYPVAKREKIKKALLERIESSLLFADTVYPMREKHLKPKQQGSTPLFEKKPIESSPSNEAINIEQELKRLGYSFPEELFSIPQEEREQFLREYPDLLVPPVYVRSDNPSELPPMVGPEELLRDSQFGGGLRELMVKNLERLKAGVLIRRMSLEEKAAFINAISSNNIQEIIQLLFTGGSLGGRGEIVFSVNEPYTFDRERKKAAGIALSEEELQKEEEDEKKYCWVMEMPITDEMLTFLRDFAYISNPLSGAKPTAFMGNPNLKNEGASGGNIDAGGISNIVVKKQGFEIFWKSVSEIRFIEADKHLWKFRSSNDSKFKEYLAQKAAEKKQKEDEKIRKERETRKEHLKEDSILPIDFENMFSLDSSS